MNPLAAIYMALAAIRSQRMFRTSSGYIGLAPALARKGDEVVLLQGGRVALILCCVRKSEKWNLIGECYDSGAWSTSSATKRWKPSRTEFFRSQTFIIKLGDYQRSVSLFRGERNELGQLTTVQISGFYLQKLEDELADWFAILQTSVQRDISPERKLEIWCPLIEPLVQYFGVPFAENSIEEAIADIGDIDWCAVVHVVLFMRLYARGGNYSHEEPSIGFVIIRVPRGILTFANT
jgi:hypothetical protein